MDYPHNKKLKKQFNAVQFIKDSTSYCRCGVKDYQEDLIFLRRIRDYIQYKSRHFFYHGASTTLKFMVVPEVFSSTLDEIANAVCTILPYATSKKIIDERGVHLIIRLPYVHGKFYDIKPRPFKYKNKDYVLGVALS